MSGTILYKVAIVLLLSQFMVVSVVSFLGFRLKKKEAEYERIIRVLGISGEEADLSTRTVSEEYSSSDYYLPVTFSTIVTICGFTTLLFGRELISINMGSPNLILTGTFSNLDEMAMQDLRWQSILVLSMGFAGAFVWSAQSIIRRLLAGDLSPSIYYSAGLRMIFAAIVSLMLSFLLRASPTAEYTTEILPVIAFLTGMMPEQAFHYIKEKFSIFSDRSALKADSLSLHMIEGINMFHQLRLEEVGIDNAQNLAEANIIELLLKTPFNANQLVDWIAQAQLYVYFKADIEKLRGVGVRSIFDMVRICKNEALLSELSETQNVSRVALSVVCGKVQADDAIVRLLQLKQALSAIGPIQKGSPRID